ncbi:MAG: hypothetical protein ACKPKO_06205, partial [Candidatus Fonsibacter sp.]
IPLYFPPYILARGRPTLIEVKHYIQYEKMYSRLIMEEKADKPTEKKTAHTGPKQWQCPICGARIWLSNKKRHTRSKKHNVANYVLSERFEIN